MLKFIFGKLNAKKKGLATLVGGTSLGILFLNNYSKNIRSLKAENSEEKKTSKSVVIIGAGVMGLTTALHLRERGYQVSVLEKHQNVAKVASYTNGAIICPSLCASWANYKLFSKNTGELKGVKMTMEAITDIKFWRWGFWFMLNSFIPGKPEKNHFAQRVLGKYSLHCLQKLEAKYGSELDLNKSTVNTIKLFDQEENLTDFLQSSQAAFWFNAGTPFKRISPEECKKELPLIIDNSELIGGLWNEPGVDTSGDIHTFCVNVEKVLNKEGVQVHKGVTVKKLNRNSGQITSVECDDGKTFCGDIFIIANGIESATLGRKVGINLPVYPMRGNIVTLALKDEFAHLMTHNIYSPRNAVVISPLKPNLLRVSADVQAVGYNHSVDLESCHKVVERVFRVLNREYFDAKKTKFHSCLRPLCGDDVPIIGQTLIPNLYAITGHGSKGWTLSFGSAQLLADIIDGKSTEIDATPYSPRRFHLIRGLCS